MNRVNIHPSVLNAQTERKKYANLNAIYDKHDIKRKKITIHYFLTILLIILNVAILACGVWFLHQLSL